MNQKLGFIGNGNMGYAILKGILDKKVLEPSDAAVCDPSVYALERAEKMGVKTYPDTVALAENCDIVLAAIKPQDAPAVFSTIGNAMKGKLLISIVAGIETAVIRNSLGTDEVRILRVMPNTPALVGEGVFGLNAQTDALPEERELADSWFSSIGSVYWIAEKLFPVLTSLSGGGPAFVAMFIEALADGGVKYGLKRKDAVEIAAKTVLGSAKLILQENMHPAQLKDNVCSPAGTTIEGVQALEEGAFRATVIRAVEESTLKADRLS